MGEQKGEASGAQGWPSIIGPLPLWGVSALAAVGAHAVVAGTAAGCTDTDAAVGTITRVRPCSSQGHFLSPQSQ